MSLRTIDDVVSTEEKRILRLVRETGITPGELSAIAKSRGHDSSVHTYNHSIKGRKTIKFGVISDTHIGHKKFDPELMAKAGAVFKKEKIKDVYHIGDITEGMSGRPGHVFELSHIGFSQQVGYAEELFRKYFKDFNIFAITGNHDQWYTIKNNGGMDVGEELSHRLPNFTYLGENEADVKLAPNVKMKLFHPNDGTAYATSYKLQKLAESFSEKEKPQILFEGHYHKALSMYSRGIYCFESGTLCGQSWFMRGKKIPASMGFYVVEVDLNKDGIENVKHTFYHGDN